MTLPNEELAAKFSRIRHAVNEIRVRAQTQGVDVEADGDGKLTALTFSTAACAMGPEVLADVVLRAYGQVREEATARANDLMTELYDDPAVNRIARMTDSDLAADRTPTAGAPAPVPSRTELAPSTTYQPRYTAQPHAAPPRYQDPAPDLLSPRAAGPVGSAPTNRAVPGGGLSNTVARAKAAREEAERAALREQARQWDDEDNHGRNRNYWQ
ncbi:YbaB/EbfC family nucleoid-associated protein [Nocardia lasii]|uniref:YbaB/EbfC family nucleoid-associated protein n=1 Tax=Nocardia lasii TaxID=1616107 RepID=A0ABW1JYW4_9NOCA